MKTRSIFLVLSILSMVILSGCTTITPRNVKNVQKVNEEEKEITVNVLGTAVVSGSGYGNGAGDAGLVLSIKNETTEVKYINWSSSSLTFDGATSRIATGSDRVVNINNIVPNTALLPGREIFTTVYAADFMGYYQGRGGLDASYYFIERPIKNNVELIISYSGKNINELKQAIYSIELEPIKEKNINTSSTAENQRY